MRIRVNFIYVTSLLDGVDVMTRRYPARQHVRGRGVATHTGDASVGQEPNFLPAVQAARFKADTGAVPLARRPSKVSSVSHACHKSAAQDHPVYIKIISKRKCAFRTFWADNVETAVVDMVAS